VSTLLDKLNRHLVLGRLLLDARDELVKLRKALERIAACEDAPDPVATGEWQTGLHCGVEDRCCGSAYEGADYGHTVGIEKALEWASNEATHALEQIGGDA